MCDILFIMKIVIFDDYQDVVCKLNCFEMFVGYDVKVFNNMVCGLGQFVSCLVEVEVFVLICEWILIILQLLLKLLNLCMISQIGCVLSYIDFDVCIDCGIVVFEGIGLLVVLVELIWVFVMVVQCCIL